MAESSANVRTALTGVRVFDGHGLSEPSSVVLDGGSLHDELELLTGAGLSTVDALRAATVLPAEHFGLRDRGAVRPGLRADLVLVDGDPRADIRATRAISRVWCAGIERNPPG